MSTKKNVVEVKVSMKNTVKEIISELDKLTPEVQKLAKKSAEGKTLWEMFKYTSKSMKDGKKVLKKDLLDLVESATELLAKQVVTPVAADTKKDTPKTEKKKTEPKKESSLKKKEPKADKKKLTKKSAESEPKKTEKAEKAQNTKSKVSDKKADKKSDKKADKNEITLDDLVIKFPDTFEDENYSYKRRDDIDTFDKLYEAFDDGHILFSAFWVSPEEQKKYAGNMVKPVKFPNDVDMLEIIYIGEKKKLFHAVSVYTEGVYTHVIAGSSMKPKKNLKGLRQSNVIWCIYEAEETK